MYKPISIVLCVLYTGNGSAGDDLENCDTLEIMTYDRVKTWMRLLTGITVMVKQAQNNSDHKEPQRTHKEWLIYVNFSRKIFIFRNI